MSAENLTERQQRVLRIVVQEYVQKLAKPVGMASIAANYQWA